MTLRTVVLAGALALALGWGLSGRFAAQDAGSRSAAPLRGPRAPGVAPPIEAAPLTRELRLKLDRQPPNPQPSRNPFVFGSRPSEASFQRPSGEPPPAPAAAPADLPELDSRPVLTLTGMAAHVRGDVTEFTAIISDGRDLHFVKRGDVLPGDYVVADVQETTITIRDGSGGERTLRLR